MKTVQIDGKHYPIEGYDHAGTPIIKGRATSVHETDDAGNPIYDADGHPKISVHVSVSPVSEPVTPTDQAGNPVQSAQIDVPSADINAQPGKVE